MEAQVTNPTLVTGYDPELKFFSTRYHQGGRTVYSMDLSLSQVASLLPAPDPNNPSPGNREIRVPHASGFAQYIREREDWVAPAIVLRAPNMFDFLPIESIEGAEFGIISFPRLAVNDLHILDGQHRTLGIHMAIKGVANDLDKARSALASAKKTDAFEGVIASMKRQVDGIVKQRKRFDNERMSIQIFVEEQMESYQQMFYDIADNALGITGSVKTRMDSTKVVNRAFRLIVLHPLIVDRIDMEKDILGRNNQNFLSAKHVVDMVRIVNVGLEGRVTKRLEDELKEDDLARKANAFLDLLVESFSQLAGVAEGKVQPAALRQSSMLGSPVTLRTLAGVYFDLIACGMPEEEIGQFFKTLDPHMSTAATDEWVEAVDNDLYFVGGLASSSRRQDLKLLKSILVGWALTELPPELVKAA